MLVTRLKKTLVSIFGKKKQGYATFANDLHIRGAAAETRSYKNRFHRLTKIRQRLLSKKTEFQEEYGRPAKKIKVYARIGALILVLAALPLAWLFGGGDKVLQGLQSIAFFRVAKIEITGCTAVTKEKILHASGINLHQTNLLTLDSKQVEARIAEVPWVARTEVQKSWPAKVLISIVENAPVALLHSPGVEGGELRYLDDNGIAFSSVILGADIDFPIVTGLTEITDQPLKEKVLAEILTFLRKVRGNDPHLPAHSVSELHVTRSGEMVVYLVEYPFPIFFGNGSTKQKYSRLIQVLRALYKKQNAKEMLSQIEYIQMDYLNDKVLVVESGSG